jgi:hypothetical protein
LHIRTGTLPASEPRTPDFPERTMKHTLAFLVLLMSAACHAPAPTLDLPRPYQRNGVLVTVKELYGPDETVVGIAGEAENKSGVALHACALHFVVLDFHDLQVGEAVATRENIEPGEKWHFEAPFSTPFTSEFDSVHPGPIVVTK